MHEERHGEMSRSGRCHQRQTTVLRWVGGSGDTIEEVLFQDLGSRFPSSRWEIRNQF